jgi:hypothetical protein
LPKSQQVFDVFDWLKKYFPSDSIVEEDIPDVLNFCLMWNLFESKVCETLTDYSLTRFIDKIDYFIKKLKNIEFLINGNQNNPFSYFEERYVTDGKVNYKFNSLHFKSSDRKPLVKSVLEKEEEDSCSILLALLIIIYRLRNNLFHGIKPIRELKEQNINFEVANRLLANILDVAQKSSL